MLAIKRFTIIILLIKSIKRNIWLKNLTKIFWALYSQIFISLTFSIIRLGNFGKIRWNLNFFMVANFFCLVIGSSNDVVFLILKYECVCTYVLNPLSDVIKIIFTIYIESNLYILNFIIPWKNFKLKHLNFSSLQ